MIIDTFGFAPREIIAVPEHVDGDSATQLFRLALEPVANVWKDISTVVCIYQHLQLPTLIHEIVVDVGLAPTT